MTRRIDPSLIPPKPTLEHEQLLWAEGMRWVAGVDEAGRGALAGPVAAGAVLLPNEKGIATRLDGVCDSKQMTAKQREYWAAEIKVRCLGWGVGFASASEIDELGIVPATRLAMGRAIRQLVQKPQHLLIDALLLPEIDVLQSSLLKGDARSLSIACASVLAKVARDALMVELCGEYPAYDFEQHKGYGTQRHRGKIAQHGPSLQHRLSFKLFSDL